MMPPSYSKLRQKRQRSSSPRRHTERGRSGTEPTEDIAPTIAVRSTRAPARTKKRKINTKLEFHLSRLRLNPKRIPTSSELQVAFNRARYDISYSFNQISEIIFANPSLQSKQLYRPIIKDRDAGLEKHLTRLGFKSKRMPTRDMLEQAYLREVDAEPKEWARRKIRQSFLRIREMLDIKESSYSSETDSCLDEDSRSTSTR